MARRPQNRAEKGSKKWLQLAVNENPELIRKRTAQHLHPKPSIIEWFFAFRI